MNLAKMTSACGRILLKRQFSCTGIVRDLRNNVGLIVNLMIWSSFLFAVFVFDSIFLRLWKYSVTLGIAISFKPNCHRFPVELEIYYARFSESIVLFLSIISQKTVSLLKEESIFPLHELVRYLLNGSPAESRWSNFWYFSLVHS